MGKLMAVLVLLAGCNSEALPYAAPAGESAIGAAPIVASCDLALPSVDMARGVPDLQPVPADLHGLPCDGAEGDDPECPSFPLHGETSCAGCVDDVECRAVHVGSVCHRSQCCLPTQAWLARDR